MSARSSFLSRLKTAVQLAVGGVWVVCFGATLLGGLPWVEFSNPAHIGPVLATAALLTLTGLGPSCLAARFASGSVRRKLSQLVQGSRHVAKLLLMAGAGLVVLTIPFLFVVGWYALVPWFALAGMLPNRSHDFQQELVLFRRGGAYVQLRNGLSGKMRPVVLRPCTPWLNLRTELPPDQPDSSWQAVAPAGLAPCYARSTTAEWQKRLQSSADAYRREVAYLDWQAAKEAAEQRRREAIETARVFNTLHFELSATADSLNGPRDSRSERQPLPANELQLALYARLGPDHVLRVQASALGHHPESFSITLANFRGEGCYALGGPPAPTALSTKSASYVELLRYDQGVSTTYASTGAAATQVTITRYDAAQQLIAGTFEGELRTPTGQTARIEEGKFEVRYQ